MIEQLAFQEVLPNLSYAQVERIVKEMLRDYHLLESKVKIRERQALGKGTDFFFTVDTSTPNFKEDKLQALHAQLRPLDESKYLSANEQRLASLTRSYLDVLPTGTRSQLHAIRNEAYHSSSPSEAAALNGVADRVEKVVEARNRFNSFGVGDLAAKRADAQRKAELEAEDLRGQKELIENVLDCLGSYKPEMARLLRLRYIERKDTLIVAEELNVDERTFRRWKQEAICEFAMMAGIT